MVGGKKVQRFKKFNKQTIIDTHGDMYLYRDLYSYRHAQHSERAQDLIRNGEIIDYIENGKEKAMANTKTPYLVLNVCRPIVDIPASYVSGTIGTIESNNNDIEELPDRADDGLNNKDKDASEYIEDIEADEVLTKQQKVIDQIVMNSRLDMKHKQNITQLLIDGGIVGVPVFRDNHISIEFKERNVYFPHDDGYGYDLVYELQDEVDGEKVNYVQIYTERRESRYGKDNAVIGHYLSIKNRLYEQNKAGDLEEVDEQTALEFLNMRKLDYEFEGRQRPFIEYWGNNANFINPLGESALTGQLSKQEEINWTLTRAGMTFQRNGKPRISVTTEIMNNLKEIALEKFGDENKIDSESLEVTEMDENGNSLVIHQIDTTKIGDMTYVKDLVRIMLVETQTSEQALDFMNDRSGRSGSASGIAKFYDLMTSIIKARQLQKEYVYFLTNLIESALWLASYIDDEVIVERPTITLTEMIPTPLNESVVATLSKHNANAQSLVQTVAELHPDKDEEWQQREVERILDDRDNGDISGMIGNMRAFDQAFPNLNESRFDDDTE